MNQPGAKNENICPREEIAAYLDGELAPAAELALERHFAECKSCLAELNLQKKMLSAFDLAFDEPAEIELPKDFAKVVATNAESKVRGLRSRKECSVAFFLCAAMLLLILAGFATDFEKVYPAIRLFSEQCLAVIGFVLHLIYGVVVGFSIILKSLSQQILFNSFSAFLLITMLFFVSSIALSRLIFRTNR